MSDDPAPVLDSIATAVAAALRQIDQLNDDLDAVELEPSGDPSVFPSVAVFLGGWRVLEREAGLVRRELSLTTEGYVENGDGPEASAARAALHAACVNALLTDPTVAGMVELIDDDDLRLMTATLASKRRLAFSQDFSLQFTTSRTDPALPA